MGLQYALQCYCTTVRKVCFVEQLECPNAEDSRTHVDINGMLPFVVLDLKKMEYIEKF